MSRPPVRPNPLDPGMADKIADRLIDGQSITGICLDRDMPAITMVYQALRENVEFRNTIAHARAAQQDAEVERTIDIADAATPEDVQVAKLRIWARQWRAAKLAPRKYGEKIEQVHVGPDNGPIVSIGVSTNDPTEAAKVYQRLIKAG